MVIQEPNRNTWIWPTKASKTIQQITANLIGTATIATTPLKKLRPMVWTQSKESLRLWPLTVLQVQSLHKTRPSTTTCTTKLAPSTSQYYFALQSFKARLSSTLYYTTCTKQVPVLFCTTKTAQTPHLRSSHPIPSLLTCHVGKFFSAVFTSSEHWINVSPLSSSQLISAVLHDRQLLLTVSTQKLETHMHLHFTLHRKSL